MSEFLGINYFIETVTSHPLLGLAPDYISGVKFSWERALGKLYHNQMLILFKNGYDMSIINGYGAQCGENTFEIGIHNPEGALTDEFYPEGYGDTVMGYLTVAEIAEYCIKIGEK